jgi:hypothetical protein
MIAAVYLKQHPLLRHALSAATVLWRSSVTGTAYSRSNQNIPHRGS